MGAEFLPEWISWVWLEPNRKGTSTQSQLDDSRIMQYIPHRMANARENRWNLLSLHFRHQYERGYRYLDHCGEFMVAMEEQFDFICQEAQPTGAQMSQPDLGLNLALDTNGLAMSQDLPSDDGEQFLLHVLGATRLACELIQPGAVFYAGFAAKHYHVCGNEGQALAASLDFHPSGAEALADKLGMTPKNQTVSCLLESGSYNLQVDFMPISFNSVKREIARNPGFHSTDSQRRRAERLNAREEMRNPPGGFALGLNADLREWNPPQDGLESQFSELRKQLVVLREMF
jgi:hypothetical protein